MKNALLVCLLILCSPNLFSQTECALANNYHSSYEKEILLKKDATHLELLMAMGTDASHERTLAVKKDLDAFVSEVKSSSIIHLTEVKLMKELHKKVHTRFLSHYKYISPFHEIFKNGQYNCVSATALFALVLEELNIPYNIQVLPNHVFIMAYPETKAISVEMTALKDAYYMPARKDVSKALGVLLDLGLTTREEISLKGEMQIYNKYYNPNSVVNLSQLAGIQYFNEAINSANENDYNEAFDAICKTEILYNVEKIQLFKREIVCTLLDEASFDNMKDIGFLIDYANLKKADHSRVFGQYTNFIHEQLIINGKRELVDSSHTIIAQRLKDTTLVSKLNGMYYLGLSEYFSNAYNLKKQLEFAELAYKSSPEIPGVQLWLTRCILQSLEKYDGDSEELMVKMDEFANKYAFLKTHNLFLMGYFHVYTDASNDYFLDDDGANGKKYFDLALVTMNAMEDKEVLDLDEVGWLYAEAGSYFFRKQDYKAALKVLEEGLKLSPNHERILARIEFVKSRMK